MAFYECGKGWHPLVSAVEEVANKHNIKLTQVKEKFGQLRIYTDRLVPEVNDAINAAETTSLQVCEECGHPGVLRNGYWLKTLSNACEEKRKAR